MVCDKMCSVSVEIENVPDVGNSLPPPLLIANVEGAGDQLFLAVLDRHHLLLKDLCLGGDVLEPGALPDHLRVEGRDCLLRCGQFLAEVTLGRAERVPLLLGENKNGINI